MVLYVQYIVFQGSACLIDVEFGTVFKKLGLYPPVDVFFLFAVVHGFVCEVSLECVVCSVCYVVFQFFKTFSYFLCGFVVMG